MKRLFAVAAILLLALPLFAADDTVERRRLVAELLKLVDAPTFHRLVMSAMLERTVPLDVGTAEERAQAHKYFDQLLGRVDFAKMVQEVDVPLVEKTFTTAELRDTIAFLKTKSGQKLMRIVPEMTAGAFVETSMAIRGAAVQLQEESRKEEKTKSPWKQTMADIRAIATASEVYATDENHYPKAATMEELRKVVEPTYIRTLPLRDAWGHEYVYRVTPDGQHYRIISGGADGRVDVSSETIVNLPENTPLRTSKSLDEDIIYQDGTFLQVPEEAVRDMKQP